MLVKLETYPHSLTLCTISLLIPRNPKIGWLEETLAPTPSPATHHHRRILIWRNLCAYSWRRGKLHERNARPIWLHFNF